MTDEQTTTEGNRIALRLADDSFRPRPPDVAVYRYRGMIWFGSIFLTIILAVVLTGLATLNRSEVGGYVGLPMFMWAAAGITWLNTVTTAVRVRPDCLVIDNWLVRHVIPWERFAGIDVETGMGLFARVDDGTIVRSSSFGRNLSDALKGYGHMRQTLGRIRADCGAARRAHAKTSPEPVYERRLNVSWRPLLGLLVFFEAFSWITFAIHGG